VFDDGTFDEDDTFLISDWFKHTPSDVLSKNFGVPASATEPERCTAHRSSAGDRTRSYYADVSLDQWMALTPPELVQAHLRLDQQTMNALRKEKKPIVPA
jgi:hypothetical protein